MSAFFALYSPRPHFDPSLCQSFLDKYGFEMVSAIGQDSSIRRYFRVAKGEQTAILMETVPDSAVQSTPGHKLSDFLRIGAWLREIGIATPQIYELDEAAGYALLEDFGDISFKGRIVAGEAAAPLYELGVHVLDHIAAQDCPLDLPQYKDSHVHKRHRRIIDWYAPMARGRENEDDLMLRYHYAWKQIEDAAPPPQTGFIHVDFHAENLMWRANGASGELGLKRCGVLDFQGGMIGPRAYDLANFLYDARLDVPEDIRAKILDQRDENTQIWVRILATQFHCRVIGQFIKMAVMDGDDRYLAHIPRLENYLAEAMNDPVLAPLAALFREIGLDFTAQNDLNMAVAKTLIAADAA